MELVQETARRIRRLEVRGARNVAIAALQALKVLAEETKSKSREEFLLEISGAKDLLFSTRPTEPLMRNGVNWVLLNVKWSEKKRVKDLGRVVSSSTCEFLRSLEVSRECIAENGSKRIRDGMVVFTHCHSSTVTHMIRKAKQNGKDFEVICTETRPVFQGRNTAKEMLDLGLKTTLIVDSATRSVMREADLVIVGADAITSEGNVVNKIGTATIAVLAREARVPFYAVSELLKFDPETLSGEYETIEERSRNEVWKDAPKKLKVRNPAFEVTRRDYIHGIICEEGVVPPHIVAEIMQRKYSWIF